MNIAASAFCRVVESEQVITLDSKFAGIVMGLIDDIPDCKTLLDSIVAEAEEVIGRMPRVLSKL